MLCKQHEPHTHNLESGKQGGREERLLCQKGENQTVQILIITGAFIKHGFLGPTSDLFIHHLQNKGLGDPRV